jgi:signal transduction histidine kinase
MSGLDVLERLAPKMGDMLTIMITAYASIETAVRATKQGAFDFLAKPFTPAELKDSVRKAAVHVIVAAEAKRLAREKRQIRFQFISVLAHELKSPLGAVEGYLKVLQTPGIVNNETTYNQIIDRCLTRTLYMRKMISDLLDLTRIESGQKQRKLVPLNVVDVAKTAMDSARPDADARGITLQLHENGPAEMLADPNEIEIILNNLVSNAVKYNRDRGRVDVTIQSRDESVSVTVQDTGIGMSQEECARLFQDFVRIKNEKTQAILGSGLGLSIVRKIAELYQGNVSATSEPDVGSVFTAVLRRTAPGRETEVAANDAT